ncbi:MAG: hypothetical protein KGI70_02925 [Patescibacteria group bacterium]|nr:hypothetical protein [Patescibacteria group bacterium]
MKNFINKILGVVGLKLERTSGRATMAGALAYLKDKGFAPTHIIDGGASDGRWSRMAQRSFPDARYTLVEMQPHYEKSLKQVRSGTVVIGALGPITLDSLIKDPERTLLKLDLDGAEPPVLAASKLLSRIPAVILECPFSQLVDKCELMAERGFNIARIFDLNYNSTGDMTQVDILFVR